MRSFKKYAATIRAAVLPHDWCRKIFYGAPPEQRGPWNTGAGWYGYAKSRRAAEDAAVAAFSKLPTPRRAELLAPKDGGPPAPKAAPKNVKGKRKK